MRSMHGIRSGHLECSSAVRRAPAAPKDRGFRLRWLGAVPVVGDIQPEYGRVYPNISKLWVFNFRDHIYS